MSFWDLEDGSSATANAATYEVENNNFAPLPEGSRVMAILENIGWKRNDDGRDERVSARWSIIEPVEYLNRKVSQAFWVTDDNPKKQGDKIVEKRTKDKKALGRLDFCCGGKLAGKSGRPSDDDFALALLNKPVLIELDVMEGDKGDFNWVRNTYKKGMKAVFVPEVTSKTAVKTTPKASSPASSFGDDLDDDIPF